MNVKVHNKNYHWQAFYRFPSGMSLVAVHVERPANKPELLHNVYVSEFRSINTLKILGLVNGLDLLKAGTALIWKRLHFRQEMLSFFGVHACVILDDICYSSHNN